MKEGREKNWEGEEKKELLEHQLSEIVNSIIIHLLGPWFHLVLCLFLGLFIFQIFINRYPIREKPSFFTHFL